MQLLQAFKYELIPSGDQQRDMRRFARSCRFGFNKALALQKENFEADGKFIGYVAMAKHLTGWRNGRETPWLKDSPIHPPQQALKSLVASLQELLRQTGRVPALQEEGARREHPLPGLKANQAGANCRIFLPKLEWLRYPQWP
ncbi:helix-turn-helix domain-containing protein [Cupriavidus sp. L7L]|uniref:helix-turn-helix domain-containing protein n=1 Tax=Cupriavidus sp. L7L TaxID=2546443 RepID=UPI001FB69BC0|nr:helix-turn-helix domain-containing protein [Cupriavidus sp. L7L]